MQHCAAARRRDETLASRGEAIEIHKGNSSRSTRYRAAQLVPIDRRLRVQPGDETQGDYGR